MGMALFYLPIRHFSPSLYGLQNRLFRAYPFCASKEETHVQAH
jgi:hypothetical protein